MIDEVQVENLALIRRASLEPARGLTVLTGETGAGKTALISALKLLMGERADKSAVRDGEGALLVSGRFFEMGEADGYGETDAAAERSEFPRCSELSKCSEAAEHPESSERSERSKNPKGSKSSEHPESPEELVVSRRVAADGRSRATLNGRMASVGELAAHVAPLVDLCGQHEHQQLMKPASHVRFLDAWAQESVVGVRAAYEEAYDAVEVAAAELARVRDAGAASSTKLEEARFVLSRIDAVNPQEGEYEELAAALAKAENAEALARAVDTAHQALADEQGALDALGAATSALEGAARYDGKLGEWAACAPRGGLRARRRGSRCAKLSRRSGVRPRNACAPAGAHVRLARSFARVRPAHGRCAGKARRSG